MTPTWSFRNLSSTVVE